MRTSCSVVLQCTCTACLPVAPVASCALQVVQRWKQKAAFREGLRTVGRQTLLITGVAGLYFGTELGVGLWREQQGDWANTAAAGALAGGLLGSRGELRSGLLRGKGAGGVE